MKDKKIQIEHVRGSGKGGQHRNKRFTGIRMTDLNSGIVVVATERRSQAQNQKNAEQRLFEALQKRNAVRKPRKPTRQSKASQLKRLETKKAHQLKKQLRRKMD